MPQVKTGYLRGCRGVLIEELGADGKPLESPVVHWVDTAQEASITVEVVEGEQSDLRGGDRLLVRVQEPDVVVGAEVTLRDAKLNLDLLQSMVGGTLVMETTDTVGWEAPPVSEQGTPKYFSAHIYVTNYTAQGSADGYLVLECHFCTARLPDLSFADNEWSCPEFTIRVRENPDKSTVGAYTKRFVATLPEEAS